MPRLIEYELALAHLTSRGLVCNYHNSGAFAFAPTLRPSIVGWIGPDDPTIRPELLPQVQKVVAPYPESLGALLGQACRIISSPIWAMPLSHWAYELEFGSGQWLA